MPYSEEHKKEKMREVNARKYQKQKRLANWNVCSYEVGTQEESGGEFVRPPMTIDRDLELLELRQQFLCS